MLCASKVEKIWIHNFFLCFKWIKNSDNVWNQKKRGSRKKSRFLISPKKVNCFEKKFKPLLTKKNEPKELRPPLDGSTPRTRKFSLVLSGLMVQVNWLTFLNQVWSLSFHSSTSSFVTGGKMWWNWKLDSEMTTRR